MNPVIPEPAANASIIDWAKPVTRALTALADKRGAAARNERDRALPKLRPWEIHFFPAATQEDEDFWGVYLPAGSLNVAGEEVTPTDGTGTALAAAGTAYPGYYVIPVDSGTSPSAFWLHIYSAGDDDSIIYRGTVSQSGDANPEEDEEVVSSIRLCSIGQANAITQVVVGAIALTPCQNKDEDEEEEPDGPYEPTKDPCEHDDISGNTGGVAADYDMTGPTGGAYYGGVTAEGSVHAGDNDCNCP